MIPNQHLQLRMKTLWITAMVLVAFLFSINAHAQVGVNTPTPDPYSILDLKSLDKGFLVPRMSKTERFALKSSCGTNCPDGLLVYDTLFRAFFYLAGNNWYALNPIRGNDFQVSGTEDAYSDTGFVSRLIIGTENTGGVSLIVSGETKIGDKVTIAAGGLETTGPVVGVGNEDITGNVDILGDLTVDGNFGVTGDLIGNSNQGTNKFNSNINTANCAGPVPKGGIIMWAGTVGSIPTGWHLCDGLAGTPDLTGRFVLGQGTRDEIVRDSAGIVGTRGVSKTFTIGDVLGADQIVMAKNEMPIHTHTGTTDNAGSHSHGYTKPSGCTNGVFASSGGCFMSDTPTGGTTNSAGSHNHDFETDEEGAYDKCYNMPPYYVLAYIMKL